MAPPRVSEKQILEIVRDAMRVGVRKAAHIHKKSPRTVYRYLETYKNDPRIRREKADPPKVQGGSWMHAANNAARVGFERAGELAAYENSAEAVSRAAEKAAEALVIARALGLEPEDWSVSAEPEPTPDSEPYPSADPDDDEGGDDE